MKKKIKRNILKIRKLSKRENKILKAANYLIDGNFGFKAISQLKNLKIGDIENLYSKILKKRQILPQKAGSKKVLTIEHIEYLKNLMDNKDNYLKTLKEIKKNMTEDF